MYFSVCVNARVLARPLLPAPGKQTASNSNPYVTFCILREKSAVPRDPGKESHLIMKVLQKKSRSPVKERPCLPRGKSASPLRRKAHGQFKLGAC